MSDVTRVGDVQSPSGVTLSAAPGGGAGTPGGSNTQVQFNDGGAFGGDAGMVYNKTTDTLTLGVLALTTLSLGGVTVLPTGTELNFVDGVTSSIQTQLDGSALLAGRSGGQILNGGIAASETLILESTSHATKGSVRSRSNFIIGNDAVGVDYTLTFAGETNDGLVTWMEDEDYFAFADDVLFDTTEKLFFRDTAIFIHSASDGNLLIQADIMVTIGVAGDIELGDSTLRVIRPNTDEKMDLGTSAFRFNGAFFAGDIDIESGNIITDTTTGMKIGTSTTQKIGLWNVTPVVQPAHVADPSGGATVDTECRAAVVSILAQFATIGLHAAA